MKAAALNFWSDEQGFLISAELVLILTIGILGLIVGISSLQSALVFEMNNLAFAFASLNQSYFVPGFAGCKGTFFGGSSFFSNFNNSCLFISNTGAFGGGGFGGGFGGGGFGGGFGGGGFGGGFGGGGGGGGFYASDFGVGSGSAYIAPSTTVATPAPAPAATCPTATCPPATGSATTAPCPQENCPPSASVNGSVIDSTPSLGPVPYSPYPGPSVR